MRKLFYLGLMITSLASCKKDDSNPTVDPVVKTDYFPLEIGNYWVYKYYEIDSLGVETETGVIDSLAIRRDTIIRNNRYFVVECADNRNENGKWYDSDIVRDSSGYLVDKNGRIKFSTDNFTDTLLSVENADTLFTITYRMEKVINQVTVPAGEFEALNFKGTITTLVQIPGISNPRYLNNLYSNNVGKILETFYYFRSPVVYEKRLVSYSIKSE